MIQRNVKFVIFNFFFFKIPSPSKIYIFKSEKHFTLKNIIKAGKSQKELVCPSEVSYKNDSGSSPVKTGSGT
jgi:hypothetical protein